MKNTEKTKSKECPLYDVCSLKTHPLSSTDSPNMAAHLGFRVFYTFIAWFVLGYKVNEGFFLAMCFFALPVFMECLKFTPLSKTRKIVIMAETIISGLLFALSLIGVTGIYELKRNGDSWQILTTNFVGFLPSGFDISVMWWILGLICVITCVDWICNEAKIDCVDLKRGD